MTRQSMTKKNTDSASAEITTVNTSEKLEEKTKKPKKKIFNNTDEIECQSITTGGLYVVGPKTKNLYSFLDEGDVVYVEYQDLLALLRTRSQFIFDPCFIILDDDFIKQNQKIADLYDSMYTLTDFRQILELPVRDMISCLEKMPKGTHNSIKNLAGTMIADGEIDSRKKTSALNQFFDVDFDMIVDLNR